MASGREGRVLEFPVNIRYKRGHQYTLHSNMDINYFPGIVPLVGSPVVEDEDGVVVVAVCFVMVVVGTEVVLVVLLEFVKATIE